MRFLLVSIFVISLMGILLIPNAFGATYSVHVPMGAAGGVANFTPSTIHVEKGDTVKWSIFDRGTHTVTSNSRLFDSGIMQENKAASTCYPNCKPFTYTFDSGGSYNYHCKIHSWMQGSVIVKDLGYNTSVKKCTNVGCVYLDEKQYVVGVGGVVLVKIYGKVNDVSSDRFVYVTIKEPNGKLSEQPIPVTWAGDFVYPLPISYDKRGKYDVIVRVDTNQQTYSATPTAPGQLNPPGWGEYNPNGSKIGSVWFEVVKTSGVPTRDTSGKVYTPQPKDITPTSIILTTDSQRYEKGSIIGIAGQLVPYQKIYGSFDVTIKVISPNGSIKDVVQIRPNSIGVFGSIVNTSNWSNEGYYEIEVNYANLIKSTPFAFTVTGGSLPSKTSTFLILDSLPTTFNAKGSDSRAVITLSGQLLTVDKTIRISGAPIKLVFTGFTVDEEDHYIITTDNDGKFNKKFTMPTGKDYGVQAVYDGSLKFQSFESQTEYFDVRPGAFQPQTTAPTEDGSVAGGVVSLLVIIMIVVIVGMEMKKRKKIPVTIPPPSGGGTVGRASQLRKPFNLLGGRAPLLRQQIRKAKRAVGRAPLLRQQIRKAKRAVGRQSSKTKSFVEPIHYLRCKHCHLEEFLENEADGQQYCTKCDWRKR